MADPDDFINLQADDDKPEKDQQDVGKQINTFNKQIMDSPASSNQGK